MKRAIRFFKSRNWDDVLAYGTVKIVNIRDFRLGMLHYSFLLAIFVYIVIVVVLVQQSYLEFEAPTGTIHMAVYRPNNTNPTTELRYCTAYTGKAAAKVLDCHQFDGLDTVFPNDLTNSFFIATRIASYTQMRQCLAEAVTCPGQVWTTIADSYEEFFLANIEDFTIRIRHNVVAPQFSRDSPDNLSFRGTSKNMKGKFRKGDDSGTIDLPKGKEDIFPLQTFLDYMVGAKQLDDIADIAKTKDQTYRYTGMVVTITIDYSNTYEFTAPASHIQYTYEAERIEQATFSVTQIVSSNDTYRRVYERHGVRLDFVQTGTIGRFKFQVLLISFVTSMGLLAVATLIVDQIALRFMPKRKQIAKHKYEDGGDRTQIEIEANLDKATSELATVQATLAQSGVRTSTHQDPNDGSVL